MKFTIEVTSTQNQAKNWILAALKRNLTGETKADILNACVESAQDLGMTVKYVKGIYVFADKKGSR